MCSNFIKTSLFKKKSMPISLPKWSMVILFLAFFVPFYQLNASTIELISVASDETQANASVDSFFMPISTNGRYVAFYTYASNLVPNDTNPAYDVFVRDREFGTTEIVSLSTSGGPANEHSGGGGISMSAGGQFIVFESRASNLVVNDTNNRQDIFVHDRNTGDTVRVSVSSVGTQSNNDSTHPFISADGRYVTFGSVASNLVAGDTNGNPDIFVHDMVTGVTERVSLNVFGGQTNLGASYSAISDDGNHILFESASTDIVLNDTNGLSDLFVYDRTTSVTKRVNISSEGEETNGITPSPSSLSTISANGRYIAFSSAASNLVAGDTNGGPDVFVHDMQTGITEKISSVVNPSSPSISDDGRFVSFTALNGLFRQAFVFDRENKTTNIVSRNASGQAGNSDTVVANISGDGGFVVFYSYATNLVSGDTNNKRDVFIAYNTLYNHPPVLASIGNQSVTEGDLLSFTLQATDPNGDDLAFSASNLPEGASFNSSSNTFSWVPSYIQAGNYTDVEFTVTDNGNPLQLDVEIINITVGDTNSPPIFTPIEPIEITVEEPLSFNVSASDPESHEITLSVTSLPLGSIFDEQTGEFQWTPGIGDSGVYVVNFIATDNGTPQAISYLDLVITVGNEIPPLTQIDRLIQNVINYEFPKNVENSFLANLRKVQKFIEEGKIQVAINQLAVFLNKLEADYNNNEITQEQHEMLLHMAEQLMEDLE
jgi:hypothetical protein